VNFIDFQANHIYELGVKLKDTRDELEVCREQLKAKRTEMINLQLENFQLKGEIDDCLDEPDSSNNFVHSAPASRQTSPLGSGPIESQQSSRGKAEKSFQLMQTMHQCIEEKNREISQLKNLLQVIVIKLFSAVSYDFS
jgi:hypothetical protein